MKLRPEVQAFAEQMEARLRANDHKGGWRKDSPAVLLARLRANLTSQPSAEDCVDVANYALMLADLAGGTPALQHQEVPREPVARPSMSMYASAADYSAAMDGWIATTRQCPACKGKFGVDGQACDLCNATGRVPSTTRQQEVGSGPVHVHESCWLIEATAPPRPLYYAGPKRGGRRNRTLSDVTEDAGRAIRFPTEDAAKLTIALICGIYTDDATWPLRLMNSGWKATEHIFDYTPLAAAPSTPEKAGGVSDGVAPSQEGRP